MGIGNRASGIGNRINSFKYLSLYAPCHCPLTAGASTERQSQIARLTRRQVAQRREPPHATGSATRCLGNLPSPSPDAPSCVEDRFANATTNRRYRQPRPWTHRNALPPLCPIPHYPITNIAPIINSLKVNAFDAGVCRSDRFLKIFSYARDI